MLHDVNPFVDIYKQIGTRVKEQPSVDLQIELRINRTKDKRYNSPVACEIAVIIVNEKKHEPVTARRDILTIKRDGYLSNISEIHWSYDPLHYVLMFPYGQKGWHASYLPKYSTAGPTDEEIESFLDESSSSAESSHDEAIKKQKFVTAKQFYAYNIQDRASM
jgi:hypothetical protein